MPVQPCREGGKPGFKFGERGKCYTYESGNETSRERARELAARQGRAIEANMSAEEKVAEGLRRGEARS